MSSAIITSVFGQSECEYIIKKSRFITSLQEIHSEAEATFFLEEIRKKYWDARHHCYAYQIGPQGTLQKSSDDGEPSGTAGRPILEVLKKSGLTNTIAIVTRYFGGIKLGASGLIRAYSHSVTIGLNAAQIVDYLPHDEISVTLDYSFINTIERLLPEYNGITEDRQFTDKVVFILHIPENKTELFIKTLTNSTNGSLQWNTDKKVTIPILRKSRLSHSQTAPENHTDK